MVPVPSVPGLSKAPALRAPVMQEFLYHGVGGAALMVAPLFAALALSVHSLGAAH